MTVSLFALAADFRASAAQLADLDLPPEVVADTLESLRGEIEVKAANVGHFVLSLDASVKAMKEAEKAMKERRLSVEKREQADFVERHLAVISGVLGSQEPIEIDDIAARLHLLIAERDELAARLEAIEAQRPVAWIEHELQGTGLRHLHFERRPNQLRDDVIAPVWTALIPRPATAAEPVQAEPIDAELVAAEWSEGFEQAVQSLPTLANAVALFDEPAQAKPAGGCGACGDACQERASCRLADESPKPISVYYFCADYRDDHLTQTTSGTIESSTSPFDAAFPAEIRERIAAGMQPPRPADLVSIRSLSLLAAKEGER